MFPNLAFAAYEFPSIKELGRMDYRLAFWQKVFSVMEFTLQVNEKYARQYEAKKKKEELNSFRNYDDETDEESTESESGSELISERLDKQINNTIKLLKEKNSIVYDKNVELYDSFDESTKHTKPKKVTLKDYHRERLLAGKMDTEDEIVLETNVYQEEMARKELIDAAHSNIEQDELFTVHKTFNPQFPTDFKIENANDEDKFLMSYVLNGGWKESTLPASQALDTGSEDNVDAADEFEQTYNFRFEQEGAQEIMTYPRIVPTSVRRKDETRKERRERIKNKKQAAKEQKKEDLKRLKNLKMQEIQEKLDKIRKMAQHAVDFDEHDIENDFDPEQYDEKMESTFDKQYYEAEVL
jgi:protein KRI1